MVVHPAADGIICAFYNSCRYYEWYDVEGAEGHKLGLKASDRVLTPLLHIEQQVALAFNSFGTVLATGGEDGHIRVFRWPTMEVIIDNSITHTRVRCLTFSPDGKFLVSIGRDGPGRVWDLSSSAVVASVPIENDEVFAFCGYSYTDDGHQVLYVAAQKGEDECGSILSFDATSWRRISCKVVTCHAITSFSVSSDGKLLAVGTNVGDVLVISSRNLQIQMQINKAHTMVVTSLKFSHDSRALVSASVDDSSRVTVIRESGLGGVLNMSFIVLVILLGIAAAYFWNKRGILSQR